MRWMNAINYPYVGPLIALGIPMRNHRLNREQDWSSLHEWKSLHI